MATRFRRDLDDEEFLDQREVEDRKAERAERRAVAEQQAKDRAAEDAAMAARVARFGKETSARSLWSEYDAAGVQPVKLDANGVPTCSLSLLLKIGWTIEETHIGKRLREPPPYVPPKTPPKECT